MDIKEMKIRVYDLSRQLEQMKTEIMRLNTEILEGEREIMPNQMKRRKEDNSNGLKRYLSTQPLMFWLMAGAILAITFSNIRSIPKMARTISVNCSRIDRIENNVAWIRENLIEIKQILKEK